MGMTKLSKEDGDKIEIKRYDRSVQREPKKCILLRLRDYCEDAEDYCYVLDDTESNLKIIREMEDAIRSYLDDDDFGSDDGVWGIIDKYLLKLNCYEVNDIDIFY